MKQSALLMAVVAAATFGCNRSADTVAPEEIVDSEERAEVEPDEELDESEPDEMSEGEEDLVAEEEADAEE